MKKKIVVSIVILFVFAIVFFFLLSQGGGSEIPITSPLDVHDGLNIFQYSAEEGIISGAYIEGDARVDFEGIRVGMRPFSALLIDPSVGWYDVSACYISTNGDPFIVMDSCSVAPKNMDVDAAVRTKEFELAYQASQEIAQLEFPSNMKRVQESLAHVYSSDQLALISSE